MLHAITAVKPPDPVPEPEPDSETEKKLSGPELRGAIGRAIKRSGPKDIVRAVEQQRKTAPAGAQEKVLTAIEQGVCSPTAIAAWLSLEIDQVRNAIRRLTSAGLIRRKNLGGYAAVRHQVRLAEIWK